MKRLFAIALLFAGLAARAQETPTVTARVEPDSIMIGDRFDYVIDVEKDLVQVVEFPVFDWSRTARSTRSNATAGG